MHEIRISQNKEVTIDSIYLSQIYSYSACNNVPSGKIDSLDIKQ
jgi:hypothetical protein